MMLLSNNFVWFYLIIDIIIVGIMCLFNCLACFCNCHGVVMLVWFFFVLGNTLYRHILYCLLCTFSFDKIDNNNNNK